MPNTRRNDFMWIFIIIGIVILLAISVFAIIIVSKVNSISGEVQTKLEQVNAITEKLKENLNSLDQLDSKLQAIDERLSKIETLSSDNPQIILQLDEIKKAIEESQRSLIIQNISQTELNNAIESAVDLQFQSISNKTNFNFIFNIVIGSLFSLGGISLGIYFIFKKPKQKTEGQHES